MTKTNKNEPTARFDFMGIAKYITAISILLVLGSLVLIFTKGLNYGVDFSGGVEMQVQFKNEVDAGAVRKFMADSGFADANVQSFGKEHDFLIRLEMPKGADEASTNKLLNEMIEKIKAGLTATFANDGAEVRSVDTVGPQVGAELRKNGILAGFYCMFLILIYVGLRFDYRYSPAAVFCLFHDAVITIGIYALFDWEVTTQTMAAVLTIMGYSLNDTIVIFDRIRENQPKYRGKALSWIANLSINETMSRTVLTYFTTSLTVLSMYFFTEGVIKDFSLAMIIGMFLGVFSTVFIATPLMLFANHLYEMRKAAALKAAA